MELSADLKGYIALQPEAALWFSGHSLTWIRASGADTAGRLSVVEHIVSPGSASPWHVHQTEDESFYVVDGQISVKVEGQVRISLGAPAVSRLVLWLSRMGFESKARFRPGFCS